MKALAIALLVVAVDTTVASAIDVGPRIALTPMAPVIGEKRALEQRLLRELADLRAQEAANQRILLEGLEELHAARSEASAPVAALRNDVLVRLDAIDRASSETSARFDRLERSALLVAAVFWLWLTVIWIRLRSRETGEPPARGRSFARSVVGPETATRLR